MRAAISAHCIVGYSRGVSNQYVSTAKRGQHCPALTQDAGCILKLVGALKLLKHESDNYMLCHTVLQVGVLHAPTSWQSTDLKTLRYLISGSL